MKDYLLGLIKYNDWANRQLIDVILRMEESEESVMLFSHLITVQNKWLNRITKEVNDHSLNWSGPVFRLDELVAKWTESSSAWIKLLESKTEEEIQSSVYFTRQNDGVKMVVKMQDIVLQVNYHSIHHRAQVNRLIREQGLTPPQTDYILTVLKEA